MQTINLMNEYETYRAYAIRAKRIGAVKLANEFQCKAYRALDTLEMVLQCRLAAI